MSFKTTLVLGIGLVVSCVIPQTLNAQLFRSKNCTCQPPVVRYCPTPQYVAPRYAAPIMSTPTSVISQPSFVTNPQPMVATQPILNSQPMATSQPIMNSAIPTQGYAAQAYPTTPIPVVNPTVSGSSIQSYTAPTLEMTPTLNSAPQTITSSPSTNSEGVVILDSVSDVPTTPTTPVLESSIENTPTPAPVPTGDTIINPEPTPPAADKPTDGTSVLSGT